MVLHIEFGTTERGLQKAHFVDTSGKPCSIQESSVDDEESGTPNILLGRDDGPNSMHLTRGQVAEILPILIHYVEHGEVPHEQPTQQ